MIYITGDTHGDFERIKDFCNKYNTTKDDYLIILGDSCINYFGLDDKKLKDELLKYPITFLLVYGNHEERPENIKTYHETTKFDGTMYQEYEYPNLLFFKDSEIYNIFGKKVLVIGGAFSINKDEMVKKGYLWFKDEQPSTLIKEKTFNNLAKNNYQVDYILSHTCPLKYQPVEAFYSFIDQDTVDKSTEKFLDIIENNTNYKKWFCGHFHINKIDNKINFLFEDIKEFE